MHSVIQHDNVVWHG